MALSVSLSERFSLPLRFARSGLGRSGDSYAGHTESTALSGFSSALATLGDVNGDAIPDYIVGAYEQTWDDNDHQGRAFVFDGQTGKLLLELGQPASPTGCRVWLFRGRGLEM